MLDEFVMLLAANPAPWYVSYDGKWIFDVNGGPVIKNNFGAYFMAPLIVASVNEYARSIKSRGVRK